MRTALKALALCAVTAMLGLGCNKGENNPPGQQSPQGRSIGGGPQGTQGSGTQGSGSDTSGVPQQQWGSSDYGRKDAGSNVGGGPSEWGGKMQKRDGGSSHMQNQ